MRILLIVFIFMGMYTHLTAQSLTVEVTNIEELKGTIRVCLVTKEEDFLSSCEYGKIQAVSEDKEIILFEEVKAGTYALSLYHDQDDNGKLNTDGMFGLPSEPYGFSNNAKGMFGPPSFEKCLFEVVGEAIITVKLR
ncbi:MAG: DUF2141 domain-containing protein [Bacteroidota bacterium]